MKKREEIVIIGDVLYCDICKEKIENRDPNSRERFAIIRGLFDTTNFDAHSNCLNEAIRKALEPFVNVRTRKTKKKKTVVVPPPLIHNEVGR